MVALTFSLYFLPIFFLQITDGRFLSNTVPVCNQLVENPVSKVDIELQNLCRLRYYVESDAANPDNNPEDYNGNDVDLSTLVNNYDRFAKEVGSRYAEVEASFSPVKRSSKMFNHGFFVRLGKRKYEFMRFGKRDPQPHDESFTEEHDVMNDEATQEDNAD